MQTRQINRISLQQVVGKGYKDFWNFKGRYVACKGSRASKKSKTTALWIITNLIKYPKANAVYVRKTERTLKDSCFSDCKWAINRLGLEDWFKCRVNPLEIEYIPTGQRIMFRGCDDPLKLTSISVPYGYLCWAVFEEAYEISTEEKFDMIDESIRGEMEAGYFKRVFILLNPWSEKHWIKRRFFDTPDHEDKLSLTTNYLCNEWLDDNDKKLFERMKEQNPRRYRVAALGEWGISDGLIFENWEEKEFSVDEIKKIKGIQSAFGLDFGYTVDETAFVCSLVDQENMKIYVFDELYKKGLSNRQIYQEISNMGFTKEKIIADSAEPKSIDELRSLGLTRIRGAEKGRDSIMNGIQFIQNFEVIIHPRCVNFLTEISNYTFAKDRFGNTVNRPIDDFNHAMDAFRYSMEQFNNRKGKWIL